MGSLSNSLTLTVEEHIYQLTRGNLTRGTFFCSSRPQSTGLEFLSEFLFCRACSVKLCSFNHPNGSGLSWPSSQVTTTSSCSLSTWQKQPNTITSIYIVITGGSKRTPGTRTPFSVQFILISCSFQEKIGQIVLWIWRPPLENPGSGYASTTTTTQFNLCFKWGY